MTGPRLINIDLRSMTWHACSVVLSKASDTVVCPHLQACAKLELCAECCHPRQRRSQCVLGPLVIGRRARSYQGQAHGLVCQTRILRLVDAILTVILSVSCLCRHSCPARLNDPASSPRVERSPHVLHQKVFKVSLAVDM